MRDVSLVGSVLISLGFVLIGLLIASEIFSMRIPYAPYILVVLSVLIVIGVAVIVAWSLEK